MTQLYALTGQMAELQALFDTDDESLKEALQNAMNEIQGEFELKADSIVRLRRNIESDVQAIDKEVERLNELKRIKKNSLNEISDYLRRNMEAANLKTIKRPLFTITLALAPERAIIDNLDAVPDELVVVRSTVDPDKKAILARLKIIRDHNAQIRQRMTAGEDVEADLLEQPNWAHLERGESSIRIK